MFIRRPPLFSLQMASGAIHSLMAFIHDVMENSFTTMTWALDLSGDNRHTLHICSSSLSAL